MSKTPIDNNALTWRKSSHSGANGACVEVAEPGGAVIAVRDSKDPQGPADLLRGRLGRLRGRGRLRRVRRLRARPRENPSAG